MMTTNVSKITGQIVRVSRRRFLNGTAGAIATAGAVLLPQQTMGSDKALSLEQMAPAPRDDFYHRVAEILKVGSESEDQLRRSIISFEHMRDSNDLAIRVMRDELADRKERSFAIIQGGA